MILKLLLLNFIFSIEATNQKDWWENGNFYQIYPRSFKDSDGDGIGDLKGVSEKIDYLKDLGMDGVWLSSIFSSPMVDFGYDIDDYKKIQPDYGSNEDLVELLEEAHKQRVRLILDFVPNHTSDQHEWFKRSALNESEYRDFYIWHPGKTNTTTGKREPPSNWNSRFRYSAWEWHEGRQEYYLHQFSTAQVDLNFRNPKVVEAMDDIMLFWLDKGVDGFRVDAIDFVYESDIDPETGTYPDEPVNDNCPNPDDWCHFKHIHTNARPESVEIIYHWRELLDNWAKQHNAETRILLSEAYSPIDYVTSMYGNGVRNGSHVPFNFELLMNLNQVSQAADYQRLIEEWLAHTPNGSYANWVLGNHDRPRIPTRFGVERIDLINILLQTLPGIAVIFNAEELGQEDVYIPWDDTVDPQGCNASPDTFTRYSRDPVRTPFRWNASKNAGFSGADKTWLPVGPGYKENNVAAQLASDKSHLNVFRDVVKLRRNEPAFDELGDFKIMNVDNVLMYQRKSTSGDVFLVILNVSGNDVELDLSKHFENVRENIEIAVSSITSETNAGQKMASGAFQAKAHLGYVVRLTI